MKKLKRTWLLMVTLIMIVSLSLTGCGADKATGGNTAAKKGRLDNLTAPGELPIVKEKITMRVQVNKDTNVENLDTNVATKMMEEATNIHLEFEVTNKDNREEKIKLMLASNDYPEAFLGANFTNNDIMDYGVRQNILIPIDEMIEKYGKRIKEVNENEYSFLAHLYAPDGHIYGLPQVNECFHCSVSQKAWINTKWLDNLGLKMPTTTDEFYNVLKAFKEQDANDNGNPNDEIPFSGQVYKTAWHGPVENYLMNPFIMCWEDGEFNTNYFYIKEDQSLGFSPQEEGWREGLKWMNKLYSEGLIDPLAFSQTNEQLRILGNTSDDVTLGGFTFGHLQGVTTLTDGDPECNALEYDALPPLAGPDGTVNVPYYPTAVRGARFAITDKCKNPEAILRWVDYAWTSEGTMTLEWGEEGVMWKYSEPGELDLESEQATWSHVMTCEGGEIHNYSWRQDGPDCRTFEGYRARWANEQDDRMEKGYELYLYRQSLQYVEKIPEQGYYFVEPFVQPDVIQEIASIKAPLQSFVDRARVEFITGERDINGADWDAYLEELKGLKSERYVEIISKAWDEKVKLMK